MVAIGLQVLQAVNFDWINVILICYQEQFKFAMRYDEVTILFLYTDAAAAIQTQ